MWMLIIHEEKERESKWEKGGGEGWSAGDWKWWLLSVDRLLRMRTGNLPANLNLERRISSSIALIFLDFLKLIKIFYFWKIIFLKNLIKNGEN